MSISLNALGEWLPFALIAVGVGLALISTLLPHQKYRREKSMQLLAHFNTTMKQHDMAHWKEIYHGTREAAFAPPGHFINRLGKPVPLVSMWTAGSEDHTAIQRMAECLEIACAEMLTHTVDIKMLWTETGQLMESMYGWLAEIPGVQRDKTFLEEQYPSIKQVFEKYAHHFKKWPYRIHAKP